MKYTFEMGSGAMIYTPSFVKTNTDIRNLVGHGGHTDSVEIA
jgi:hypothetical protein